MPTQCGRSNAVGERGSALVVDEQERDAIGAVGAGHAEHPRLQELGLSGAGRAADERVRALTAQVERHRSARSLADDGAQVAGALESRARGVVAIDDRVVLAPALDDDLRLVGDLGSDEREERHGMRDVGVVVDDDRRVDDGRQATREHAHVRVRDALDRGVLVPLPDRTSPIVASSRPPSTSTKLRQIAGRAAVRRCDEQRVHTHVRTRSPAPGSAARDRREHHP